MRHLTADELVDLAEGTRAPAEAPHLAACEDCRRHLADLQSAMWMASVSVVPEPSPLFWDHLARRVREALALEGAPSRGAWIGSLGSLRSWFSSGKIWLTAGALAALVLAVVLTMRIGGTRSPADGHAVPPADVAAAEPTGTETLTDDPSLGLVVDLTADMDWQTAQDAGLTAGGSADHAVAHLSAVELVELDRLLKEALAKPGA